jgi:hypothetical protein
MMKYVDAHITRRALTPKKLIVQPGARASLG